MTSAAAPGPAAGVSVVLVVEHGGPGIDAFMHDRSGAEPGSEVILVANGRGALDTYDLGRWPGVRIVALHHRVPFATAANRGAGAATGQVLCFVAPGAVGDEGWLAPLVAAVEQRHVACAVPQVIGKDGRVLEAGSAVDRDGGVTAIGDSAPGSFEHLFPRRTGGGSRGCICVRRSAFTDKGGFDPNLEDLLRAGTELVRSFRVSGLEAVYEPRSRMILEANAILGADDSPNRSPALRDSGTGDRMLLITRALPFRNRTHSERRVAQLVSDLSALMPDGRLTLLALDGHNARDAAPRILAKGVEVVVGPEDWNQWFGRRELLFSHVLVTDIAALRRLGPVLDHTQPQAHRIMCLPSLEFQDVVAAAPHGCKAEEKAEVQLRVRQLEDEVTRAVTRFHAAWCATPADRAWVAAAAPAVPCEVVPTAATSGPGVPYDGRSGYVVLASPGADQTAGHEDAALHAAREIFPTLLARDPNAFLRVVVDEPSPSIQLLASRNIELVPAGDDPARWFRRSRVCLAWYPRGTGSREAISLALDARTPFVTSPAAVRDQGFGSLPSLVAADDLLLVSLRAEQLNGQRRLWDEVHHETVRLADGPRSGPTARLKLLRACASAGVAPPSSSTLHERIEPIEPAGAEEDTSVRPRRVAIVGSAWKAAPPADDDLVPSVFPPAVDTDWTEVPVNEQYQRWCARYGPTPLRLARLARRLQGLVRRPTISIVMPVFNTEASWLHDAIASVREQVYENWELCIADDGSVNQATLDVLAAHEQDDSRIRVVRLPGQQGIAGASNAALAIATGQFVGFLDHDDELKPHALGEIAVLLDEQPTLDLIYTDEDKREPDGQLVDPFFKPDWSPDHLMCRNYVCHLLVLRRTLLDKLGGFRLGYDGSQDYDLVLRATELTTRIAHLAEPLYTWRKVEGSTAIDSDAKPWALDSARRALKDALDRRGTPGDVVDGLHPTTYRVRYALRGRPKVSILIPTRDKVDLLRNCIDSIRERSTYTNYEIVVVDNQSTDAATLGYLATFPGRVVRYPHRFNYSRIVNLAAHHAGGDMLLFLNNDTQVVSPDWLEALLEHGQRPEVGVVGPRLLYPSGHPQHEGTVVGYKGGHAGNVDHRGFWGMGDVVRNCSAVTGACLLMRPSVYWELGGHDERLRIAFNDVDLCLRARQAGYEVIYTPYAELIHVEGGTRGIHAHLDDDEFFESRWVTHKCLDPYYNANFERLYPFRIRS